MNLDEVAVAITKIKTMIQQLIDDSTITSEQANIIYPIILEQVLKSEGVKADFD